MSPFFSVIQMDIVYTVCPQKQRPNIFDDIALRLFYIACRAWLVTTALTSNHGMAKVSEDLNKRDYFAIPDLIRPCYTV